MDTGTLSLIIPEGEANACPDTDASEDILRGRTLDNVLEITDSSDVIVEGITFWASNIIASDSNDRVVQLDLTQEIEVLHSAFFIRNTVKF